MLTKNELYLKLAIFINHKLYEGKSINYITYKKTEEKLLHRLKKEHNNGTI